MNYWDLQQAQARFNELLETAMKNGPQILTQGGVETAVVVSIEEWRRLQIAVRPPLKTLLLAPRPRFEKLTPEDRSVRRRPVVEFK